MAICEQCGKEHGGTFGSGRFCCRSCSNKWVALHQSEEAKSRKVEKGKSNLIPCRSAYVFSNEDRKKGGLASSDRAKEKRRKWLEGVFSGDVDPYHGGYSRLREALIEFGYKEERCECCGNTEWMSQKIPLELHHIDEYGGHRLENLQILCPNCHSLTDNHGWGVYNKRKKNMSIP